jgi:hypothetical protein
MLYSNKKLIPHGKHRRCQKITGLVIMSPEVDITSPEVTICHRKLPFVTGCCPSVAGCVSMSPKVGFPHVDEI